MTRLASELQHSVNTINPEIAGIFSGMKAAINSVPSLSVLDGWWLEGHIEGETGWAIGNPEHKAGEREDSAVEAVSLYDKLEHTILPMFYHERDRFLKVMLQAIALNGSFFNAHRMVKQYALNAYAYRQG